MLTTISSLPQTPSRNNATTFATDAETFLNALPTFRTELNNFAEEVNELPIKTHCKTATTANITLSGTQTIDGISVVANDRVLVKDQTTASQNGVYIVASGAWSRATDFNTSIKTAAGIVPILSGTVNGGLIFYTTFKSTDTLGTTNMTWFRYPIDTLTTMPNAVTTFLTNPTSTNLRAAVTDEIGTGSLVFSTAQTGSGSLVFATSPTLTSPTLTTPIIGVATATSINGLVLSRGTGSSNTESVAIGSTALDSANTGSQNTAIGFAAGTELTSGSKTIFIGYQAGKSFTTGADSIYIGQEAQASSGSASSEIVIGKSLTGKGNDTTFIGGSNGVYNQANTTTWATTSDQRIKKNISDNLDGLDKIKAIRVRNFEYRLPNELTDLPQAEAVNKTGIQIGVIAQEMLPECVHERSNGLLSVDTDKLIWYLINAVKQLATRIEQLDAK